MTDRSPDLTAMTESWAKLTGSAVEAAVTANAAALDAITATAAGDHSRDSTDGATPSRDEGDRDDDATDLPRDPRDDGSEPDREITESERRAGSAAGVLYETDDWTVERSVSEKIAVGDQVTFSKSITDADVRRFAAVTGDTNRLHLDDSYAAESRFGGRIVHGGLVSALISAALARLPGVIIYLSQDLSFRGPVGIGDRASATVEVAEAVGGDRYRVDTVVEQGDDVVVDGEAVVLVEASPDEA